MKDVSVYIDDYKFNFRVCALIENNGRYLLEQSKATDFLNMPGGRVHAGENTFDAIKRELQEEMNLTNVDLKLLKVAEQFFQFDNRKYHELDFVYYVYLPDEHEFCKRDLIPNLDNPNETMIWVDKADLHNHKILPEFICTMTNDNKISHEIVNKM